MKLAGKKRGKKWASLVLTIIFAVTSLTGFGGAVGKALAADSPITIANRDFETGDLTGWMKTGTSFDDGPKADTIFWGNLPFHHQGTYHMWTWNDDIQVDMRTGTLKSSTFSLGGNGEVNFLVGGTKNKDLF